MIFIPVHSNLNIENYFRVVCDGNEDIELYEDYEIQLSYLSGNLSLRLFPDESYYYKLALKIIIENNLIPQANGIF